MPEVTSTAVNLTAVTSSDAIGSAFDVETCILALAWTCLNDTPANQKNFYYDEFIASEPMLWDLASAHPLEFAPGLSEILQSETPPTVEYFQTLPDVPFKGWGVYLIVLGKPGHPCRTYIGSATASDRGITHRFYQYDHDQCLPRYYEASLREGFSVVHRGLLCWTPSIPPPAIEPVLRLLYLLLEATFSYIFWAMRTPNGNDYGMAHICPWDRFSLEYTGLCSHCSLNEGVFGEFNMSAEELEALAVMKKQRKIETSSSYHYKQMETNYDAYLDDMTARVRKHRTLKHKEHREWENANRKKHFANKTYHCALCNTACHSQSDLTEHEGTDKHLRNIAATLGDYRYNCNPCGYHSNKYYLYDTHCKGKRHKKKVADYESSNLE